MSKVEPYNDDLSCQYFTELTASMASTESIKPESSRHYGRHFQVKSISLASLKPFDSEYKLTKGTVLISYAVCIFLYNLNHLTRRDRPRDPHWNTLCLIELTFNLDGIK